MRDFIQCLGGFCLLALFFIAAGLIWSEDRMFWLRLLATDILIIIFCVAYDDFDKWRGRK